MADKFTRLGAVQGDVLHATTAGGSKSIESLEDNIDAGLFGKIYADNTGGSHTGNTSETTLVTYTIPANSVNTGILVLAGIRYNDAESSETGTNTGTFRLKIAGSTVKTIVLSNSNHGVVTDNSSSGTAIMYWDASQTWSGTVAVTITGQLDDAGTVYVDSFVILGI